MIVRLYNDYGTDFCDYEADTIEDIRDMCKDRIKLPTWSNGWSELIKE